LLLELGLVCADNANRRALKFPSVTLRGLNPKGLKQAYQNLGGLNECLGDEALTKDTVRFRSYFGVPISGPGQEVPFQVNDAVQFFPRAGSQ
jgi:hypothetical protein